MTLAQLVANRENVHIDGHPDWDAGYISAMALVEAYLEVMRTRIEALPEPTLGLKGGINRKAVLAILDEMTRPT